MAQDSFDSQGNSYQVSTYPCPADGKKYPAVLLVHGNAGLTAPYGVQIRGFAEDLSKLGYFAAVPKYYQDDNPHPGPARTMGNLRRIGIIRYSFSAFAPRGHENKGILEVASLRIEQFDVVESVIIYMQPCGVWLRYADSCP